MVGTAMIYAHEPGLNVPAHRVVNRNGLLTGKHHYETPTQMQELLEADGIQIKDDQVLDFRRLFWDPLLEL